MEKNNAVDYLREYQAKGNCDASTKQIIEFVLANKGSYSPEDQEKLFEKILESKADSPAPVVERGAPHTDDEQSTNVVIKSLKHIKGVNALQEKQEIAFSDSLTIIYGLNGTGKSGYFRILNQLVGGERQKYLLPNVYSGRGNDYEVRLDLCLNGTEQKIIKWTHADTPKIDELAGVQVFDSDYFATYFGERKAKVGSQKFGGLHLFGRVTDLMDQLRENINKKTEKLQQDNNIVTATLELKLSSRNKLQEIAQSAKIDTLKKTQPLTEAEKEHLKQFKQEKTALQKDNPIADIKLNTGYLENLKDVDQWIQAEHAFLSRIVDSLEQVIQENTQRKATRKQKLQEFEAIRAIPKYDSDEWNQFIEAGNTYKKLLGEDASNENCLYCRQPLQGDALALVAKYAEFLADKSKAELDTSNNSIEALIENIGKRNDYDLDKLKLPDEASSDTIKKFVRKIIREYSELRTCITYALEERKFSELTFPSTEHVLSLIEAEKTTLQDRIKALKDSNENKKNNIADIDGAINDLEDKAVISEHKEEILALIKRNKEKLRLVNLAEQLKTHPISQLSREAHDKLFTHEVKDAIQEEVKRFKPALNLDLSGRNEKGTHYITIKLAETARGVKEILSEGEQKIVALGMFLAELKLQANTAPIILDDPVTSLDNKMMEAFASQLIKISESRQVVIFTHNLLFLDALVYSSRSNKDHSDTKTHHICKNYDRGCSGKGKHVRIYELKNFTTDTSGRVLGKELLSCKYWLDEAEKQENNNECTQSAESLRSAIQYFIDETILMGVKPLSNSNRGENINWEKLKQLCKAEERKVDENAVEELHSYWKKLSNRGPHLSRQSTENLIDPIELNEIIKFLRENSKTK